jgi:two-component system, OmpR family, response regulator
MPPYILIVDDEQPVRLALGAFLTGLGYEVGEAANGVEALHSIAARRPDLMILDVMMAPLTGWEVLRLVAGNPQTQTIRVLLLTALNREAQEAYGWHLGCDWYQVKEKPLDYGGLALIIERLLAIDPLQERQGPD